MPVHTSKWAVCPKLDIDGDAKMFDSEEAAKRWLQSHGNGEWLEDPLPVISRGACIGPVFSGPRFSGWLPADKIAPLPDSATTPDELAESALLELRGQTAWPTCYLDQDWQFESLEDRAWKLAGHGYNDLRNSSLAEVVFKAMCDFDGLVCSVHVPTSAVVSFWQSWQVHRHTNQLCKALETSKTARTLRADFHDCEHAKWTVRRLVNTYARQMLVGLAPDGIAGDGAVLPDETIPSESARPPKADGKGGKRGPNTDYETAARVAEIVDRIASRTTWRQHLDDMCDELDEKTVRCPKTWKAKGYRNWSTCGDRHLVIEAIRHHLERAKEKLTETIP